MADETKPQNLEVEVFRPGTHRAMDGRDYTFSAEDVAAMAAAYDASGAPAPAVVGHPAHDDPAFGWADGFRINDAGVLVATIKDIEPAFADALKAKRYRKISLKLFPPGAPGNPKPEGYYPRHIGFLGGAAPAVTGLKPVEFATEAKEDDLIEIEFSAERALKETAGVFRKLREFFIAEFGLEEADTAVPEYMIRWIDDNAEPEAKPAFAAPPETIRKEEPSMSPEEEARIAAREAEVARREAALAHDENVAFADALVAEGRLPPAQTGRVVAIMDGLAGEAEPEELAFSVGDKEEKAAPLQAFKDLLSAQPKIVALGEHDLGDPPATAAAAFAAPDNLTVDPDQLATHNKAMAFMASNPGVEYLAAVTAVSEA